MKYILALIMLIPCVSANIVISQVLYDPIATESGGEAVELQNVGSEPVDISGWVLETEASRKDATLPSAVLFPGDTYLIADTNWETKRDNATWKSADHEEAISLGNSNSGVAIKNGETIIDSIGWGDEAEINPGLFEGSPTTPAQPGMALLRMQDTDDNSEDIITAPPSFEEGILVPITIVVTFTQRLEVSKSLHIAPEGVLTITNHATSPVQVELVLQDLWSELGTISKAAIQIEESSPLVIDAGVNKEIKFKLNAPKDALPGKYTSMLRVKYTFLE